MIFSLAWNIMFTDSKKILVLKFTWMKDVVFLQPKSDEKIIFTDYS